VSVATERDRQTVKAVCGVRTNPGHWANTVVHSFRRWLDDHTVETWCDLTVDLADGARQTTDLISCLACGQGSWRAFRGDGSRL